MRWWRFDAGISEGFRTQAAQFVQGTLQQAVGTFVLKPCQRQRIAQLDQAVFLKRDTRFKFIHSRFDSCAHVGVTERPRPIP